MKVVGICGGIGSGKSVVVQVIHQIYNVPYFDCDHHAKELYYEHSLREQMVQSFGLDPIDANGQLKKAELRQLLMAEGSKKSVEQMIHNALQTKWLEWKAQQATNGAGLAIMESAILFTSGYYKYCDSVLAVECSSNIRKRRVEQRDEAAGAGHFKRIDTLQKKEKEEWKKRADTQINNSGELSLIHQIEQWYSTIIEEQ